MIFLALGMRFPVSEVLLLLVDRAWYMSDEPSDPMPLSVLMAPVTPVK